MPCILETILAPLKALVYSPAVIPNGTFPALCGGVITERVQWGKKHNENTTQTLVFV